MGGSAGYYNGIKGECGDGLWILEVEEFFGPAPLGITGTPSDSEFNALRGGVKPNRFLGNSSLQNFPHNTEDPPRGHRTWTHRWIVDHLTGRQTRPGFDLPFRYRSAELFRDA